MAVRCHIRKYILGYITLQFIVTVVQFAREFCTTTDGLDLGRSRGAGE